MKTAAAITEHLLGVIRIISLLDSIADGTGSIGSEAQLLFRCHPFVKGLGWGPRDPHLSELTFTWYAGVTDIFNLFGHLYKVLAYILIYQAIFIVSIKEPYQKWIPASNMPV